MEATGRRQSRARTTPADALQAPSTQASPQGDFSTPRSPRTASLVRVHPPLLPTRCCVLESLATDCAAPMHIKYVVVEGFRVYRDRIELAPLSPKHNVVGEPPDPPRSTPRAPYATAHPELPCYAVGANGAGKSNLFNGACRRIGRSLPPTPAPVDTEAHARAVRWQPSSLSWAT